MNNDLIDRYYTEYLHINPPIYDLEKKQPNIYANEFIKEMKQLRKKYIRMLKNKRNLILQEKILLHDLQYEHKSHPFFPITLYSNRIIDYWEESKISYSETRKLLFIQKSKALYEITSSFVLVKSIFSLKSGVEKRTDKPVFSAGANFSYSLANTVTKSS